MINCGVHRTEQAGRGVTDKFDRFAETDDPQSDKQGH